MPMKTVCGLDVRSQDERIILQHVLPSADGGQEEKQNEDIGGCRQEAADRRLVCPFCKLPVQTL